jgi:hypothetical protein
MSFRITVKEESAKINPTPTPQSTGAMVVRSPKGNIKPTKIFKGDSYSLLKLFGYPSTSYPDIQDALDYVEDSDLWVSAPYDTASALYGGVIVTTAGTEALTVGVADPETFSFATVSYKEEIGEGDGILTNFVNVLDKTYVNNSLSKIVVGTSEIAVSVTDAEPEVISGTGITSGTLTRATGTIDVTFDSAVADGTKIYAIYEADMSAEAYFALFSNSPQTNDERVKVSYNTDLSQFEFTFDIKNQKGTFENVDTYEGSNLENTFNAIGENIFMDEYLKDVPYFTPVANTALAYSTFTDDSSSVEFAGGNRSATFTITEYTAGWDYFKQSLTYPVAIFIDVTADSGIPAVFDNLRKNYQKYSRYLVALPKEAPATSITTKDGYSIDNRGLYFYWSWFLRKESYTRTRFWSPLMGKIAVKHAEIVRGAFGGLAPAWFNENGLGGQISATVEDVYYSPSETELQNFDTAGINPVIKHPLMVL